MNEEQIRNQLALFDKKIRKSFEKIREDIFTQHKKLNDVRAYMNEWDKKIEASWKEEQEKREKFGADFEEFEQKLSQLKIALSSTKSLKNELVVVRDLSKIEERMKNSFKKDVNRYKIKVDGLRDKVKEDRKRLKFLEKETENLSKETESISKETEVLSKETESLSKEVEKVPEERVIIKEVEVKGSSKQKKVKQLPAVSKKKKTKKSRKWSVASNFNDFR